MTNTKDFDWEEKLADILLEWSGGKSVPMGAVQAAERFKVLHPLIYQAIQADRQQLLKALEEKVGEIGELLYNFDAYPRSDKQAEAVIEVIKDLLKAKDYMEGDL